MNTLITRWLGPMPHFFAVIFWLGSFITSLSVMANFYSDQLTLAHMAPPHWLTDVVGYLAAGAALVAKFTVDWKLKAELDRLPDFRK